jgi:type II secretory pathway component PulF
MPRFSYTAINSAKKSERGVVTAESAFAARKHLRAKGLHPTDIHEVAAAESKRRFVIPQKRPQGSIGVYQRTVNHAVGGN